MSVSEWEKSKVGGICIKIGSGATPTGGANSYKTSGISLIRSQNVLDYQFSFDGLAFIDDEQADKLKSVTVEDGDILLNITGDSVARSCIVPKEVLPARVNQHVSIVRVDKSKALNKYVFYYIQNIKSLLLSLAGNGGTRNALTKAMIEQLDISLPSLPEQKAIAVTLSALDDMIELNNKINKNHEEMAQAIFKSWFVDFEPFKDGEFEESELGLIPKGWRVGTFGEVAEITSGKRPVSKQDKETPDFYVPLVGASCIMGYVNETLYNEPIIVIGRVGTHGIVQRFNTQCWPSDNTLVIKSNHYEFAYQILKGIDYRAFNRGSTQPLITQTDIKNYKIVIPDSYYLSRFEDTVKTLYKQYTVNNSESRLLERIRDMILPKLINGEIRVPVEEVI